MSFHDVNLDELNETDRLAFVDSYLNDPVATALAEDMGREFRSRPADQQIAELLDALASSRKRQLDLPQRLEGLGDLASQSPEVREVLEKLRRAYDLEVEQIEARLRELGSGA